MKKILLAITFLFTLLLTGCGSKGEPFEEIRNYHESPEQYMMKGYKKNGKIEGIVAYIDLETNRITEIREFKNGIFNGKYESYHSNGNIESIGTYKDGYLDGLLITYYEDGKTIKSKDWWKNKDLVKSIDYDKEGNIIFEHIWK